MKRAIQQKIENPVAKLVLEGKFGPKDVIPVDYVNGGSRLGGWCTEGGAAVPCCPARAAVGTTAILNGGGASRSAADRGALPPVPVTIIGTGTRKP